MAGAVICKLSKFIEATATSLLPPKSYVAPFADANMLRAECDTALVAVSYCKKLFFAALGIVLNLNVSESTLNVPVSYTHLRAHET